MSFDISSKWLEIDLSMKRNLFSHVNESMRDDVMREIVSICNFDGSSRSTARRSSWLSVQSGTVLR
jgi:hypothetical protein